MWHVLFAKKLKKIRQIWPRRSLKHFTAAYRGFPPCTQSQPPINRETGIQQCTTSSQSHHHHLSVIISPSPSCHHNLAVTISPYHHLAFSLSPSQSCLHHLADTISLSPYFIDLWPPRQCGRPKCSSIRREGEEMLRGEKEKNNSNLRMLYIKEMRRGPKCQEKKFNWDVIVIQLRSYSNTIEKL